MDMDAELTAIIQRHKRENAAAAARTAASHAAAYQTARELAAEMGRSDPTLRRVILFGSALPRRRFRVDSDIDLAIEGGDLALCERVAARLSQPVDVLRLEDLRSGVRRRILSEGEILYEFHPD